MFNVFLPHEDGSMTVRTGDIGRFRPDGVLEYLGRKDDMVKVAGGNRVDLKEVEGALLRLAGWLTPRWLRCHTPRGENRLRAFVVLTPARPPKSGGPAQRALGRSPALCHPRHHRPHPQAA